MHFRPAVLDFRLMEGEMEGRRARPWVRLQLDGSGSQIRLAHNLDGQIHLPSAVHLTVYVRQSPLLTSSQ